MVEGSRAKFFLFICHVTLPLNFMCTYLIEGALRIPSWCLISWIKYMPKLLNTNIHYTLEEKKMASVPVRDGNVHTIPYCGFLSWGKKFTNITQNEGQGLHWLCGIQCYHARLQNCLLDCFWESSETEATSTSLLYPSMLANISCYARAF